MKVTPCSSGSLTPTFQKPTDWMIEAMPQVKRSALIRWISCSLGQADGAGEQDRHDDRAGVERQDVLQAVERELLRREDLVDRVDHLAGARCGFCLTHGANLNLSLSGGPGLRRASTPSGNPPQRLLDAPSAVACVKPPKPRRPRSAPVVRSDSNSPQPGLRAAVDERPGEGLRKGLGRAVPERRGALGDNFRMTAGTARSAHLQNCQDSHRRWRGPPCAIRRRAVSRWRPAPYRRPGCRRSAGPARTSR